MGQEGKRTLSEHQIVALHEFGEGILSEVLNIGGRGKSGSSDKAEENVPEVAHVDLGCN